MKTKVLSLGLLVLSWWSILCIFCVPAVACPPDPGDPDPPCCSGGCADCELCSDCACNCMEIKISPFYETDFLCIGSIFFFKVDLFWPCYTLVVWTGGGDPASQEGVSDFFTHWDTPGVKTVTASIPCGSSDQAQITIIDKVEKVVEAGTDNEGPLYVCLNDTVGLEAKSYPPGATICSVGWLIISQPAGSHPSITPNPTNCYFATLSGLDKPGNYEVYAYAFYDDEHIGTGDTITVTVKPPVCDNCHSINDTAFECGHYKGDANCASNWCIINVLDTATCDYHPDANMCPSDCKFEVVIGEPEVLQRKVMMTSPICLTGGEPVQYHDWYKIYYGCSTCAVNTGRTACETFGCPGTIIESAPRGDKIRCAGSCP